jgi:polyhydroxyalkanoate depolymerase
MNPARHLRAQAELYRQAARGEARKARAARAFYDEYFTVTDLPAEFYLETVQRVFQDHRLALGRLEWRGQRIDPRAIQRTALLTVEGERDDICAAGQTVAAHDLCTGLPPSMRRHHLQAGAGHYGVFTGRRWRHEVYPQLRSAIRLSSGR